MLDLPPFLLYVLFAIMQGDVRVKKYHDKTNTYEFTAQLKNWNVTSTTALPVCFSPLRPPVFPPELAMILHFVDFIPLPFFWSFLKLFVELMFSLEIS